MMVNVGGVLQELVTVSVGCWGLYVWLCWMGMRHSPIGLRYPCRTGVLLHLMITSVAENSVVQPLSHNCPMDSSAFGLSAGNKWAIPVAGGNIGRSNSPSCVDLMWL
jgi:hypothetical protein